MTVPVYLDESAPRIADPARGAQVHDWLPANDLTIKFVRCLESIRDLRVPCEFLASSARHTIDKRFVKGLATPLLSLAIAIKDVFGEIEHSLFRHMPETERTLVLQRKSRFDVAVLDRKSALKAARDKIGAHIDTETILSGKAIWDSVDLGFYVQILNLCLCELNCFLQLDDYAWTRRTDREDIVQLMNVDGSLVSFVERDGELDYIESVSFVQSPRKGFVREVNEFVATVNRIVAVRSMR